MDELEKKALDLIGQVADYSSVQGFNSENGPLYRFIAENTSDVLFIQDMNLRIIYVSPSVTPLFGYTQEEAKALSPQDFMTPDSLELGTDNFLHYVEKARRQGDIDIPLLEYEYICKDGSTLWGELKTKFLFNPRDELKGVLGILRDISKKKATEIKLRESEAKFRALFDLSPLAIALSELGTGRLVDVNEMLCRLTLFAREDLIGIPVTEIGLYTPEDRSRFLGVLNAHGEVKGIEMDFKIKDGTKLTTLMFAKEVRIRDRQYILTAIYDKTEQKRLEAELLQSQKMEAIGSLAGGIAHDFNNLLMGILGNITLMLMETESTHPHFSILKGLERQVLNGAKLTGQLLGYARKGKYEVSIIALNEIIREASTTFNRTHKHIRLVLELAPNLSAVEGDSSQIDQVLLNLFLNAADAFPQGGEIVIRTQNVTHRDMTGRRYTPKEGKYVCLEVEDTGVGMDPETRRRVFEPFFTTKELGKGTGLGLASVYGIVKGHGGYIDVESEPGEGTTFFVYLPASDKRPVSNGEDYDPIEQSHGTILLVEDEEFIMEASSALLENLGYKVLKAGGGKRAVEVYQTRKGKIDLVILDMVMPGMGGGETFDRIKALDPGAKVLLSSGYTLDSEAGEIMKRGCDGFIQKPYKLGDIARKITEILNKKGTSDIGP